MNVKQFSDDRVNVLGVGVSVLTLESARERILAALEEREKGYICVSGMHGVCEAQRDSRVKNILNAALLNTPDGMPMVWMGKLRGHGKNISRVYGPDLMLEVFKATEESGHTHFLCGGGEGLAEELKAKMSARFPRARIVGAYTPPFRPLNADEEADLLARVGALKPDIIWVGLSTPKQERFMKEYLPKLDTTLMFGVGAAFDFHAGRVPQAPRWMQRGGLEWFYRLCKEPRRLWKRYLANIPAFMGLASLQLLGLKRYPDPGQEASAIPDPVEVGSSCGETPHPAGPPERVHLKGEEPGKSARADEDRVNVLGVGISVLTLETARARIIGALDKHEKGYISVADVNTVCEARRDAGLRKIVNASFLCTPEGMPMVWMGRLRGFGKRISRVYGPDLMLEVFKATEETGHTHFFYGGAEGVADLLKEKMRERFPKAKVVGACTPPFRPLNAGEERELVGRVARLKPDLFWVGISAPKQNFFMHEFLPKLDTTLMLGVGAAFDFHSGTVKQAPRWMQRNGLEWVHRFCQEPRRLGKRYLRNNPFFLASAAMQVLGLKRYDMLLPENGLPRN